MRDVNPNVLQSITRTTPINGRKCGKIDVHRVFLQYINASILILRTRPTPVNGSVVDVVKEIEERIKRDWHVPGQQVTVDNLIGYVHPIAMYIYAL